MAAWHARQPAGQGRRHCRQAAADRSRQRAGARQPRLRRAGARHPGRPGGDGVDGRRQPSAASPPWPNGSKPATLADDVFARTKQQMGAVFNGALGYAALKAKDYDKARRHYREAVAAEPDNLQDVYQLAVSQLEGTPLDALGFWYAARSIAIARAAKNEAAAADIDRYVRSRYRHLSRQRGGLERTAGACRRGRARAARGLREVDPARADAAGGRPAGRRRATIPRRCPSPTGRLSCAIATPRRPTRRRPTRCGRRSPTSSRAAARGSRSR